MSFTFAELGPFLTFAEDQGFALTPTDGPLAATSVSTTVTITEDAATAPVEAATEQFPRGFSGRKGAHSKDKGGMAMLNGMSVMCDPSADDSAMESFASTPLGRAFICGTENDSKPGRKLFKRPGCMYPISCPNPLCFPSNLRCKFCRSVLFSCIDRMGPRFYFCSILCKQRVHERLYASWHNKQRTLCCAHIVAHVLSHVQCIGRGGDVLHLSFLSFLPG